MTDTIRCMGDNACWLDRVCLSCGRFIDDEQVEDDRCPHCGEELDLDQAPPSADAG